MRHERIRRESTAARTPRASGGVLSSVQSATIRDLRSVLVASLCVILGAPAHAQVRRNEQQRPASMTIEEYEPRSMLVTRETPVRRAKFPFVDIHGHQDLTMSDAELASLVKQMDAMECA